MVEDFYPERRRTNPASGQGRTWTWEPVGAGGGEYSPIKMTWVLVVPSRRLNLRIGTTQGART